MDMNWDDIYSFGTIPTYDSYTYRLICINLFERLSFKVASLVVASNILRARVAVFSCISSSSIPRLYRYD